MVMDKSDLQETLVSLYLRLNGYFVSGFIVQAPQGVGTEIDILAVRFPQHQEPAREVLPCPHLATLTDQIDFLIGEVKGGRGTVNFNVRFRDNPAAIRSVLQRFGAFADSEIDRLNAAIPDLLDPSKLLHARSFPALDVKIGDARGALDAKLRFIPFAAEQARPEHNARPYLFADDLINFIWQCFRPPHPRPECDVQYNNYELWGPHFAPIVYYFKDKTRTTPGTIHDLYAALCRPEDAATHA